MTRWFLGIPVLAAAIGLMAGGCSSSSASSKSVSTSISSPFTSSSGSSSPADQYRADVRDFTAAHVRSGGDAAGLMSEVGKLANKNGISDWESSEDTFRAIGAGLAKAGLRKVEMEAYKANLTTTKEQAKWLQDGYDDAR